MSTPYMAFSSLIKQALGVFWGMWLAVFLLTRTYALHEAYQAEVGRRNDERWLLLQCQDSEFYANLKQHSNLCTEVANNARESLLLRAIGKVAEMEMRRGLLNLCGSSGAGDGRGGTGAVSSCSAMLMNAVMRMGWQATALLAVMMLVAPNLLLLLVSSCISSSSPSWRKRAPRVPHPWQSNVFPADAEEAGDTTERESDAKTLALQRYRPMNTWQVAAGGAPDDGFQEIDLGDSSCCNGRANSARNGSSSSSRPSCDFRRGRACAGDASDGETSYYCHATRMQKSVYFRKPLCMVMTPPCTPSAATACDRVQSAKLD